MDQIEQAEYIGYSGGFILSLCLIPQIYLVIKTKEVENISYIWQFLYILGISLHLYYSIFYRIKVIYIPTIIELCLVFILLFLKLYYKK